MRERRLEGELLGFTFRGEDSGFAVARIRTAEGGEITAVGSLSHLSPGQRVVVTGQWKDHPTYGRQLRVSGCLADDPRTLDGMRAYLSSGAVTGVGPELARRLVDCFGLDTLRVLSEEPEKLESVHGIGPRTVERIRDAYRDDLRTRELLAALQGRGVSDAVARRVLEEYGAEGLAVLQDDPFRLAREIRGMGFRKADAIARAGGMAPEDHRRVRAAVEYVLQKGEENGHCFLPEGEVVERAARLDVPERAVRACLARMEDRGRIRRGHAADPARRPVQMGWMAALERRVARELASRASLQPRNTLVTARDAERATGLTLNPDQRRAVEQALRRRLLVVTGGPGTGKTTLVQVILAATRLLGEQWRLAAPTGRAARRLSESTGQEAVTLHRLLEFTFPQMRFARNRENPLEVDGVLVDESSMVDIRLAAALLDALSPETRLVLVGDDHQLPSVGPGQVLYDLIESGVASVVRLTEIYRQEEGSGIVLNAHRVDRGEMPVSSEREPPSEQPSEEAGSRDFFVVSREDVLEARATLLDVVTRRLPRHGFDPMRDIQVLVPMHQGELGTVALNRQLRDRLNAVGPGILHKDRRFRVGDRVIQVRNDYRAGVFNGEVGWILTVEEKGLTVDFDGRRVALVGDQLDDVELAYAITVHKSQGSEYPAVVVGLARAHHIMLQRNLLYTAITRARRFCCIVGSRRAIRVAVALAGRGERHTLLRDLLLAEAGEAPAP